MRPDDLLSWIRAIPFVPFRMRLNSGQHFDIRHPEMLKVGRSAVNVYTFAGEPTDPFERLEMLALILIESIEPLEAAHPA